MSDLSLTEFLLARIAEDQEWVRHPDWCRSVADDQGCDCDGAARMLAECEAKRRIVEIHRPVADEVDALFCDTCHDRESPYGVRWPCNTMVALALPDADHPDCREEWKP